MGVIIDTYLCIAFHGFGICLIADKGVLLKLYYYHVKKTWTSTSPAGVLGSGPARTAWCVLFRSWCLLYAWVPTNADMPPLTVSVQRKATRPRWRERWEQANRTKEANQYILALGSAKNTVKRCDFKSSAFPAHKWSKQRSRVSWMTFATPYLMDT